VLDASPVERLLVALEPWLSQHTELASVDSVLLYLRACLTHGHTLQVESARALIARLDAQSDALEPAQVRVLGGCC
jgi:hypothetical protein